MKKFRDHQERLNGYRALFGSDLGKMVIEDLKGMFKYGQTLYEDKSTNGDLHFQLGKQAAIHDILFLITEHDKG